MSATDDSVIVRPTGSRFGGAIGFPAGYVAEYVDTSYAVTAHRVQEVTVDTTHVPVEPTTTSENFYVAMTHGKHSNNAYVVLDRVDEQAEPHLGDNHDITTRSVLYGALQHAEAEMSVHETVTAEQEHRDSNAQLAAEYEAIPAAAQRDRWAMLIRYSGLTADQVDAAIESEASGALSTSSAGQKPTTTTSTDSFRV